MTESQSPTLMPPIGNGDHVLGPSTASVQLVEYGDYECPYCGAAHAIVQQVLSRMQNRLLFAFRHFPLSQIHPHAERAAEAAEAAGSQGGFWPMHDMLFAHQNALSDVDFARYAASLNLDVERFIEDLSEKRYAERVRKDFLSGVRSGVNGTPTFFINGRRHDGPWDLPNLLTAVEHAAASPVR